MRKAKRDGKKMSKWKIVLLSLVFLVLLEPIVMYRVLQGQKEARQAARAFQDRSLSITPDQNPASLGE